MGEWKRVRESCVRMKNLWRHTCAEIHDVVQGGGVMREVGSDSM